MCQFVYVRLLQDSFKICLLFHLKRSSQHAVLILFISGDIIALGRGSLIGIFLSWLRNIDGALHLLSSHLFIHIAMAFSLIKPLPFLILLLFLHSIPLAYQLFLIQRDHQSLPLLVFYRSLYAAQPQIVCILILEAKMGWFASLRRRVINRLQGQAKVIRIFCAPDNIVGEVVYLDLLILFRIENVVLTVKTQFFLLPHTQAISSGIGLADDETFALDDRRREDI